MTETNEDEEWEHRLKQRQRQIDLGKNTLGYDHYTKAVPRYKRIYQRRHLDHPRTPDRYRVQSKRAWDGLVRQWRRQLHLWDEKSSDSAVPESTSGSYDPSSSSSSSYSDDSPSSPSSSPSSSSSSSTSMSITITNNATKRTREDVDDSNLLEALEMANSLAEQESSNPETIENNGSSSPVEQGSPSPSDYPRSSHDNHHRSSHDNHHRSSHNNYHYDNRNSYHSKDDRPYNDDYGKRKYERRYRSRSRERRRE